MRFIVIFDPYIYTYISATETHKAGITPLPPLRVCALRTSPKEPDIHVILLDPEALIKMLLMEEARFFAQKDAPNNPKRQETHQHTDAASKDQHKSKQKNQKVYEIAQLLLSCIHAWGLDPILDDLCKAKLGMLKPQKALSFGLLTRGRLALMFPGWYLSGTEEDIAGKLEAGATLEQVLFNEKILQN